jgi:hypothetical protein
MAYTDIDKPDDYFNTVLYTGTGATQSVTGVGFAPDFTWIKSRAGVDVSNHRLFDVIRGVTKELYSDLTDTEGTNANSLTTFGTDGFTVGSAGGVNAGSTTYASWNWLAGGTAVSNTAGSITSSVSANTTAGFSIVSYTSQASGTATVGHGLGVAPKMIIVKTRGVADSWRIYHASLGASYQIFLNLTNAQNLDTGQWNATAPTADFFTLGTSWVGSYTSVAYCFADVKGFSKFGSYTGNGSADGAFVYTGFKPAFVMVKRTDTAGNSWRIWDKVRSPSNVMSLFLYANLSNAEDNDVTIDFLSNGFKFRNTSTDNNASGATYIYMAFAENPFVTSTGIPTPAR